PLGRSAVDEVLEKSPPRLGDLPEPNILPKIAPSKSEPLKERSEDLLSEKAGEADEYAKVGADVEDEKPVIAGGIGETEDSSSLEPAEEDQTEDLPSLWSKLLAEVRRRRPLIQSWVETATPLGRIGAELLIGFPANEQLAMESLLRANNRKFVEELLTEIAAAPRTIRAELRDDLVRPATTQRAETTLLDGFKNDPLIQKALEIFRAEIEADT
ncbi:MAG TPA: hypothetical protein VFO40_11310, partial [Chthoniobacterales bacterium]|nr:hypothetical protein [Chthoniobacterales bacterium]